MLLAPDYYDPTDLTGYVRAALADYAVNRFTLSSFLPDRVIDDLDYRFVSGGQGLAQAASFRAYDAESPVGSRPGVVRKSGELPPISRKIRFGEYDRLRQRTDPEALVQLGLESDAARMALAIAARMELARGDALVNGSVTISENGVVADVDWGRSGGNSVTADTLWSDLTDGDPIDDMTTWVQYYVDKNGVPPGAAVVSRAIVNNLARSQSLLKLAATVIGTPVRLSISAINDTFAAFSLPPLTLYDVQVDVDGSATRVIPSNVLLLLPEAVPSDDFEGTQLGATLWGTTAESLETNYGLATEDRPGIVAGVYSEEDPVSVWTKAAAIGLPVLANPDLSFAAIVG